MVLDLVGSGTRVCISEIHNFNCSALLCVARVIKALLPTWSFSTTQPTPCKPAMSLSLSLCLSLSLSLPSLPPTPLQLVRCLYLISLSLDLCSGSSLYLEHSFHFLLPGSFLSASLPPGPHCGPRHRERLPEALPSVPQSPFLRAASPGKEGAEAALVE